MPSLPRGLVLESNEAPAEVTLLRAQELAPGHHPPAEIADPGVPEHVSVVLDDPTTPLEDSLLLVCWVAIADEERLLESSLGRISMILETLLSKPPPITAPLSSSKSHITCRTSRLISHRVR